jgi:hypothetical protein
VKLGSLQVQLEFLQMEMFFVVELGAFLSLIGEFIL